MSIDHAEREVQVGINTEMTVEREVEVIKSRGTVEVRIDSVIVSAIALVAILESTLIKEENVALLLLDLLQVHPHLLQTLTLIAASVIESGKSLK